MILKQCGAEQQERRSVSLARGAALFLGGYTLIGVFVALTTPTCDPNLWWVDLRTLPEPFAHGALVLLSVCLLLFALRRPRGRVIRIASAVVIGSFSSAALFNASVYWSLAAQHAIASWIWMPVSGVIFVALVWIGWIMLTGRAGQARPAWMAGFALVCAVVFPLLQIFGFGKTDYQRHADVAVVFGARVYADGTLSDAVADRVHTAVALYQRGLVPRLVMSGGPGNGAVHETEAMRAEAIREGVPASAILIDPAGLNTTATVHNTRRLARTAGWHRVIAVSEFYHLPRIKLAYAAEGLDVYTVPAQPRHWARAWAVANVMREVPAFWVYWVRAATISLRASHA